MSSLILPRHSVADTSDDIARAWLEYGRDYAKYPSLWDGSLSFASGPLRPEGGVLNDYSGKTAGAAWSVGDGDVPKYVQGSVKGQVFWTGMYDGINDKSTVNRQTLATNSCLAYWFCHRGFTQGATYAVPFGDSSNNDYYLGLYPNTLDSLMIQGVPSGVKIFTVPTFAANEWHHVAIVRYAAATRVYFDGVESTTGPLDNTAANSFDQLGKYGIPTLTIRFFYGDLSSILLTQRTLSSSEISTLARHPLAAYEVQLPTRFVFSGISAASPWLYARRRSHMIGSGLGV